MQSFPYNSFYQMLENKRLKISDLPAELTNPYKRQETNNKLALQEQQMASQQLAQEQAILKMQEEERQRQKQAALEAQLQQETGDLDNSEYLTKMASVFMQNNDVTNALKILNFNNQNQLNQLQQQNMLGNITNIGLRNQATRDALKKEAEYTSVLSGIDINDEGSIDKAVNALISSGNINGATSLINSVTGQKKANIEIETLLKRQKDQANQTLVQNFLSGVMGNINLEDWSSIEIAKQEALQFDRANGTNAASLLNQSLSELLSQKKSFNAINKPVLGGGGMGADILNGLNLD